MVYDMIAGSLINIVIILLFGVLISVILERYNAEKFVLSNTVVLLSIGIILSCLQIGKGTLFQIDQAAIAAFSTIAIIIIVFDASFSLRLSELDSSYKKAMLRFLLFFAMNLVFLTLLSLALFGQEFQYSIYLALIFSILMTSINSHLCFTKTNKYISRIKIPKGRVFESIRIESLIGLPFIILLPFILAGLAQNVAQAGIFAESFSVFYQLLIGISIGILLAVLVIIIVRSKYSEYVSSISLLIAAFLAYVLAEEVNGNGIAAVIAVGLFYSSIYVKNRQAILEHSSAAIFIMETIVFLLVAFAINLNISVLFLLKTLALFALYLSIRFVCIMILSKLSKARIKEIFFLTLQVPKGVSIVVVILALSNFAISGIDNMLSLAIYFVLLSHILSLVVMQKAEYFLPKEGAQVTKELKRIKPMGTIETKLDFSELEKKEKNKN